VAKFIAALVLSLGLWSGLAQAQERAGLREQLRGVNPSTAEGGERVIHAVHQALFNPNKSDRSAARGACQSSLPLAVREGSRLPMSVQVKGAESTAHCAFLHSRHKEARGALKTLLGLCRPDDCWKRLNQAYALVRRWMWPKALKDLLSAQKASGIKGGSAKSRANYATHLEKVNGQLDVLKQLNQRASLSLAKRRGKGGIVVEAFPASVGGAWGGLRVGDIILSLGGRTVRSLTDFKARMKDLRNGNSANRSIYFLREGLGYERTVGPGKLEIRVIEAPPNGGM
jgi:hypothetical protein